MPTTDLVDFIDQNQRILCGDLLERLDWFTRHSPMVLVQSHIHLGLFPRSNLPDIGSSMALDLGNVRQTPDGESVELPA